MSKEGKLAVLNLGVGLVSLVILSVFAYKANQAQQQVANIQTAAGGILGKLGIKSPF
jgi:uncharacterized membrane protein YdcZ (DUF606 family)